MKKNHFSPLTCTNAWLRIVSILAALTLAALTIVLLTPTTIADVVDEDPYQGILAASEQSETGNEFTLTLSLNPLTDLSETEVRLFLPDNAEQIDPTNPTEWLVNLPAGETQVFQTRIRLNQLVSGEIRVWVNAPSLGFSPYSYRIDTLSAMGISVNNSPNSEGDNLLLPAKVVSEESSTEGVGQQEVINGTVNINGRFTFDDPYDNGRKGIRWATIRVYEDGWLWDTELGNSWTNDQGYYSVSINYSGTKNIYVKIFPESNRVKVTDGSGLYYGQSSIKSISDTNSSSWYIGWLNFDSSDASSPWQAYHYVHDEAEWIAGKTGGWYRSQLEVQWPVGNWPAFSYNAFGTNYMVLPRHSTWNWDAVVIYHEAGHSTMWSLYRDRGKSTPTGWGPSPHYIFSVSSGGFAITEGWAEFMAAAVKNNASANRDSGGCSGGSNNTESNNWHKGDSSCSNNDGNVVEGAAASIFWDIFDAPSGDDDSLQLDYNNGGGSIWTILRYDNPVDMNDFWNKWNSRYGYRNQLCSIYFAHGINKDEANPSGGYNSPSNGTWVGNSVYLSGSASDECSGVNYIKFTAYYNGGWHDVAQDWSAPYETTWNLSGIPDGTITLGFDVYDKSGRISYSPGGTRYLYKDTTGPSAPTSIWSSSHTRYSWATDTTVDVGWSGASDSGSGVSGYSIEWSTSSGTIPDTNKDTSSTYATSPTLYENSNWYFHVRAVDSMGNWSGGAAHYGPFYIDSSGPSAPNSASPNCSATNNSWQNSCADPNFTWSGAGDSGSGISGYYYYWGTDSGGTSSNYTTGAGYNPGAVPNPSTYYLRVQTRDNVGWTSGWNTLYTFRYDGSAPNNPGIGSSSHSLGGWSADTTVDVNWSGASDGSGSGVSGYSIQWSTSAATIPDTAQDTSGTSSTSAALSTGTSWYFHVRTRDNAGNWNGGASHYGPFYIDANAPSAPTSANPNCTATNNAWQKSCADAAFTWAASSDSGSGLAGYYYYWGTDPNGTSGSYTSGLAYDPAAVPSPSTYYLRVQSRDNVGLTSSWNTLYTLRYDATPPNDPAVSSSSHALSTWAADTTIDTAWSGASDGAGSGIAGYSYGWSTSATILPDTAIDTTATSFTSSALSSSSSWYFHVRTRDNVGNWSSSAAHYGPFFIDSAAPTNPTISSTSHSLSTWTNDATVDMKWSNASDGSGSGVGGYSVQWSNSATTVPDDVLDTPSTTQTSGVLTSGNAWYFHVRTRDNVGNWNSGAAHFGPIYIDTTSPSAPTTAAPGCAAANNTWQNACSDARFSWSGAADANSGISGYYTYWGTDPAGTSGNFSASAALDPAAVPSDSIYYLRVQARDGVGQTSPWITLFTFKYDPIPPALPIASSTSHSLSNWSADPTVDLLWNGAIDGAGSGVGGYSIQWSTSATTLPDTGVDTTGTAYTSDVLTTGNAWYFHIRVRDNAGNWTQDARHYGPFFIDTRPPAAPGAATAGCTARNNAWQNTCADASFTWTASSDVGSGLEGYYYYWGNNENGTSSNVAASAAFNPAPVLDPSVYYLRLQAFDKVGQTSAWVTAYTLKYDATAPSNPTPASTSHSLSTWSNDNTIDISWTGASDGVGSGIGGYSFQWSTAPTTLPNAASDTTATTTTSTNLPEGTNLYFHIRAGDQAGNWAASATHLGPFYIDVTPPASPSAVVETHSAPSGIWQNKVKDTAFTWAASSDARSGLAGYYVYFGKDPNGTSSTWVTDAAYDPAVITSQGAFYLRVQSKDNAGNTSEWVTLFTLMYDSVPPINPTINSAAMPGTWVNDNTLDVNWVDAVDASSGVKGYSILWDQAALTLPDKVMDTTSSTATSNMLPDGAGYYFHIRTLDNAGNWAGTAVHFGPISIDTIAPTAPNQVTELGKIPSNTWQRWNGNANFTWSGASDTLSGIEGYYYYWGPSSTGTSPNFITPAAFDPDPFTTTALVYLRVQTRDLAGNTSPWADLFTLKYDRKAPASAITAIQPVKIGESYLVRWSGTDDASGMGCYDVQYRQGPTGTWTDWMICTQETSAVFGPSSPVSPTLGDIYYFRTRAKDVTGNVEVYPAGDGDYTLTVTNTYSTFLPTLFMP